MFACSNGLLCDEQYAERVWPAMRADGAAGVRNVHLLERLEGEHKLPNLLLNGRINARIGDEYAIQQNIVAPADHILHVLFQHARQLTGVFFANGHAPAGGHLHLNAGLQTHQVCADVRKRGASSARMQELQRVQNEAGAHARNERFHFLHNLFNGFSKDIRSPDTSFPLLCILIYRIKSSACCSLPTIGAISVSILARIR